jgi:hypothetical protein
MFAGKETVFDIQAINLRDTAMLHFEKESSEQSQNFSFLSSQPLNASIRDKITVTETIKRSLAKFQEI